MKNLKYNDLEIQDYFNNKLVRTKYVRQIFKYKTRMSKVLNNFKNSGKNECHLCFKNEDTQKHLLECEENEINNIEKINYQNIFSKNKSEIFSIN